MSTTSCARRWSAGRSCISDRYVDSSIAYQAGGRQLPVSDVRRLSTWATGGLRPDLTVLLDIPPEIGLTRLTGPADRLEGEALEFHQRVRRTFLDLASQSRRALPRDRRDADCRPDLRDRDAPGPPSCCRRSRPPRCRGPDVLRGRRGSERLRRASSARTQVVDAADRGGRGGQRRRARRPGSGMSHAWLFTGPPGSGRSVAARAFGAALQCADGGCGTCHECHTALSGAHADVEIVMPTGLSYSVAETRELVARAALAPTRGRWQVTIVEDADRFTEQALNALLKALEEPPPRGVWLLCAPSVEDLLPTIRSRCRLVTLRIPPMRCGGAPSRTGGRGAGRCGLRRSRRAGPHRPGPPPRGRRRGGAPPARRA